MKQLKFILPHLHFGPEIHPRTISRVHDVACDLLCSHFPELAQVPVKLSLLNMRATMGAVCGLWANRIYVLLIGSGPRNRLNIAWLDDRMLRGLVAHELCHFVAYKGQPGWRLLLSWIRYCLDRGYRQRIERATDLEAIRRGFGTELAAYAHFAVSNWKVSPRHRAYKARYYMSSAEILEEVKRMKRESRAAIVEESIPS
jgi:hypothetical protein